KARTEAPSASSSRRQPLCLDATPWPHPGQQQQLLAHNPNRCRRQQQQRYANVQGSTAAPLRTSALQYCSKSFKSKQTQSNIDRVLADLAARTSVGGFATASSGKGASGIYISPLPFLLREFFAIGKISSFRPPILGRTSLEGLLPADRRPAHHLSPPPPAGKGSAAAYLSLRAPPLIRTRRPLGILLPGHPRSAGIGQQPFSWSLEEAR
ncbi:unnamed protein product, partial [Musa banksii]